MERSLLMSDKKKDRPWDGRSRIPTQQYKDNYDKIFKKHKTSPQNGSKPRNAFKKPRLSTNLQISAEIVKGTCPHCDRDTMFVSIWRSSVYRCMTCGYDVKQRVNGKISYIPHVDTEEKFHNSLKVDPHNG